MDARKIAHRIAARRAPRTADARSAWEQGIQKIEALLQAAGSAIAAAKVDLEYAEGYSSAGRVNRNPALVPQSHKHLDDAVATIGRVKYLRPLEAEVRRIRNEIVRADEADPVVARTASDDMKMLLEMVGLIRMTLTMETLLKSGREELQAAVAAAHSKKGPEVVEHVGRAAQILLQGHPPELLKPMYKKYKDLLDDLGKSLGD